MNKPSKKVIGIMIVTFAVVVAFIGADKIRNGDFAREKSDLFEGEVEPGKKIMSLDYFINTNRNRNNTENYELPETMSEFVLSSLFGNYNDLKINSNNSPENIDFLTTTVASQSAQIAKLPNKYTIIQLKTFPDYRRDDVRKYGNQFSSITKVYITKLSEINQRDPIKYIKEYTNTYSAYADSLARINVPRSISDEHLNFVNNLHKTSLAITKLAETDEDPILTALILTQYNLIKEKEQPEILSNISNYFKLSDIIFSDIEDGAMWNNF